MNQDRRIGWMWFGAFTGVFSLLMIFVFWGTWSPSVAPVMPDDAISHPLSFATQFRGWVNGWLANGKFIPTDFLWSPLLVSKYYLQEFKYAASAYFAALGLVWFLRGRGLTRLSSYGAGLFLAFCGYWFSLFSAGHGGWFIWMSYGIVAFALADRAVRFNKFSHWILFGATIAWGSFYQADLWLLFTAFTGIYTLVVCAWEKKFPLKGFALALLTFAIIAGPSVRFAFVNDLAQRNKQIAESSSHVSTAARDGDAAEKAKADDEARWIFVTNWSLPPAESLEFAFPRLHGDTSCPMTLQLARAAGKDVKPYTGALGRPIHATQGNYRQHSLYVGFLTCLLALVGCLSAFSRSLLNDQELIISRRRFVIFFTVMAFVFWLFSLGRNCEVVYRLVYALPFGDYLRAPVKWHHLTEFCLCVLAAFGLEYLLHLKILRGSKGVIVVSLIVLVGAIDLARINKIYCAPIDLSLVRGKNAAADVVLGSGKGKVADLIERGNGLLAWSFSAHEVEVTGDLSESDVRWIWVGAQNVAQDHRLANFLKERATPVGAFSVGRNGIFASPPSAAAALLYKLKGAQALPIKSPWEKPNGVVLALGIISFFGTCVASFIAVKKIKERLKCNRAVSP